MVLASPPIFGTPASSTDGQIVDLGSPLFSAKEWIHVATKYLIELVKERIESYAIIVFKQQHWESIREHVVRDRPSETKRTWTQVRDKWHKFKRHYYYKEMKMHNIMDDNAIS